QLRALLPPPARGATFHTEASGHGHIGQVVNVDTLAGSLTLNAPTPPPEADPVALPAGLDTLYRRLVSLFSLEELAELAFLLRIDPESLPGQTKPARARALLLACHRADRLPELLAHLRHARPTVTDWGAA
ncbi:MAG: hypothetical protein KC425_05305, partial [Anaerolineales bacterium]|nr:hypothetical protein [Anaerolineales bacterium]